jgi:serine/threonine protein kinase
MHPHAEVDREQGVSIESALKDAKERTETFVAELARKLQHQHITDSSFLPWDLFPNPDHLPGGPDVGPYVSKKNIRITEAILHTMDLAIRNAQMFSKPLLDGISNESINLEGMAKIHLTLNICERRDLAKYFVSAKTLDSSLPLSQKELIKIIGQARVEFTMQTFLAEQFRILPSQWSKGCHINFEIGAPLPLKILGDLGSGSQGVVDKVELIGSSTCARKTLKGVTKEIRDRYLIETNLLKRLNPDQHHVVEVFATYTRGRELGILMLPVADRDLWSILEEPEPQRRTLIADNDLRKALGCLCMGLTHIHRCKIRHQDIKPQNILLHNGRFLYTDFGLSKDVSGLADSVTDGRHRGTPKYSAPEVELWKPRGRAADVFSLGCVLMEIWSVLNKDENRSFSSLSPFSKNITAVMDWMKGKQRSYSSEGDLFWLRICHGMLQRDAKERPKMKTIITPGTAGSREAIQHEFFCPNCLLLVDPKRRREKGPKASEPRAVVGWSACLAQSQESDVGNHVQECATPVMGKFPTKSSSLSDQNKLPSNENVCISPNKLVEEMGSSMQAKSQDTIDVEEEISGKPKDHSIAEESGANETLSGKLGIMWGNLLGNAVSKTHDLVLHPNQKNEGFCLIHHQNC